jgi:hypothetical protein
MQCVETITVTNLASLGQSLALSICEELIIVVLADVRRPKYGRRNSPSDVES